jgi:hypothetical protein
MVPILVLCFARLDTLQQTLDSILKQPHGTIYVSCDGPVPAYERECAEVRDYITELLRIGVIQNLRISDINEGTLIGVSKGIDWFFDQETIGVIIEDDLVLEPRLLEAVEISSTSLAAGSVISVGLFNRVPIKYISNNDLIVRRSNFVISCGWVTTRKEWNDRITSFQGVNYLKLFVKMIGAIGPSSAAYHLWLYKRQLRQEKNDVRKCNWDSLWQVNCFLKNKTVAVFNRNLITNIGIGPGATHDVRKSVYSEIVPITEAEFKSLDLWKLHHDIDKLSDSYFIRDRKLSNTIRVMLRIRSRLRLR